MKKYVIAQGNTIDILLKEINLYVEKGYAIIPPIIEERRKNSYGMHFWVVLMELQSPGETADKVEKE